MDKGTMIWSILSSVAALVSMVAIVVSAIYVRAELKGLEKDRFLSVTSELFSIWQGADFMRSQMWLLHELEHSSWQEFIDAHHGDAGEISFHRVGSFYDRVGTLIRLKLINETEILSTLGGYAIAVWQRIEPLVIEARRIENSVLFDDFENMLPACYECYVPALGDGSAPRPTAAKEQIRKITVEALKGRMDRQEHVTVVDVRQPVHVEKEPATIPGAILIPPDDIGVRCSELPKEREIALYCA